MCPFASPPALRRLGLPPLACRPSPVPAGVPVVGGHKALPFAPGFGYNPLACRPAGQFNPFYPAGPSVRSLGCAPRGPPDKSLFVMR